MPISGDDELSLKNQLAANLKARLPAGEAGAQRVEGYYLPLFFTLRDWVLKRTQPDPLFVGLNGPQGAGKSTLSRELVRLFADVGLNALTLSIDDFYLTRAEQVALAARFPENPYLQSRGYPGTHDIALGERTLSSLRKLRPGEPLALPSYDKSRHSGQGDRKPEAEWPSINEPVDLVLLEGWMLGFEPVSAACLPDRHFLLINGFLPAYDAWHKSLDAFVLLKPLEVESVITWRIEAEERMKASGASGMSQDEIASYIAKFLPAYRTFLEPLARGLDKRWAQSLTVEIGRNRLPTHPLHSRR